MGCLVRVYHVRSNREPIDYDGTGPLYFVSAPVVGLNAIPIYVPANSLIHSYHDSHMYVNVHDVVPFFNDSETFSALLPDHPRPRRVTIRARDILFD